jgi:hypothetical protein
MQPKMSTDNQAIINTFYFFSTRKKEHRVVIQNRLKYLNLYLVRNKYFSRNTSLSFRQGKKGRKKPIQRDQKLSKKKLSAINASKSEEVYVHKTGP